jgi:hypothetical protein
MTNNKVNQLFWNGIPLKSCRDLKLRTRKSILYITIYTKSINEILLSISNNKDKDAVVDTTQEITEL